MLTGGPNTPHQRTRLPARIRQRRSRAFASSFGVIPVPVMSAWAIVAVALGAVLIANALAIGPAVAAARSRPASLLRAE